MGTIMGTVAAGEVAFGSALDTLDSTPNLKWDDANQRFHVNAAASTQTFEVAQKSVPGANLKFNRNGVNTDLSVTALTSDTARIRVLSGSTLTLSVDSAPAGGDSRIENNAKDIIFKTTSVDRGRMTSDGNNFLSGEGGLATTATDGFPYVPSAAGIPTGTPTTEINLNPRVFNRTGGIEYIWDGSNWIPQMPSLFDKTWYAGDLDLPNNSDYDIAVPAPNARKGGGDDDVGIAVFPADAVKARAFEVEPPAGVLRYILDYWVAAASNPTAPDDQIELNLRRKEYASNVAPTAWSTPVALDEQSLPAANTRFQKFTDTGTIASIDLAVGKVANMQISRNIGVTDELPVDLHLWKIRLRLL